LKKREVAWVIILYNITRIINGNVQIVKLIIIKMIAYSGHTRKSCLLFFLTLPAYWLGNITGKGWIFFLRNIFTF